MVWLEGYAYRRVITIPKKIIVNDGEGFPLTLILSDSNFDFSKTRSDGYDVVFTDSDGLTLLPHEREYYDQTNGNARFHVKIPALEYFTECKLYMYYGKASDTDHSAPSDVWPSEYVGVWHLGTNLNDSTSYGNHGINHGTVVVDTAYGKMREFDGDPDCYIEIPNATQYNLTNEYTIMCLVEFDSFPSYLGSRFSVLIARNSQYGSDGHYMLMTGSEDTLTLFQYDEYEYIECIGTQPLETNKTYAVCGWSDTSSIYLQIDDLVDFGNDVSSIENPSGTPPNAPLQIGRLGLQYYEYAVNGRISEVRIFNGYNNFIREELLSIKGELAVIGHEVQEGDLDLYAKQVNSSTIEISWF